MAALDSITGEFTTIEKFSTSVRMTSGTTVDETSSSSFTTEIMTSSYVDDVTNTSTAVSSALSFSHPDNVTFPNSTMTLENNSSIAMTENDTDVDLDAMNIAMTLSLTPTIAYLVCLMIVGTVGNTVALLVYYRRFKPSATRVYILAMSLCDILANVISLPSEIIDIRYTFTFDLPWLCKSVRFVNSFLTLTSAFVLVAVARDRYKKICRPMEKQRPLNRIKLYVLICALASLALSVVFGALNGSQTLPTGVGNSKGFTCSVRDVFVDTLFPLIYNIIMALAFLSCVVIMTLSYIFIALELWRHKQKQARVSGAGLITRASSGKEHGRILHVVVEDTSSGPVHDSQHSETNPSSSANPLKAAHKTANSKTFPGSDKRVLLLSIKNMNYEGPSSSVEDSDEGCFSAGSTDTTSGEISKEGQAHYGPHAHGDSTPDSVHATKEPQDEENKCEADPSTDKSEEAETAQNSSSKMPGTVSTDSNGSRDGPEQTNTSKQNRDDPASRDDPHNIGSADHLHPDRSNMVDRSPSLLQRLLTPRRHLHGGNRGSGKPVRCQISKKRGAVKSIPSSTTLMMFVLTAIFIINYLPHLIIISLRAMLDDFGQGLTGSMLNVYNIGLRSYFMNSAANSLVYGFCSARFRQECRLLFSRK
ncbi:hypothetical protein ACOMHN_052440 [Nucella lapillus]